MDIARLYSREAALRPPRPNEDLVNNPEPYRSALVVLVSMLPDDQRFAELLAAAILVIVVVGALQPHLPTPFEERDAEAQRTDGEVVVGAVYNDYDQRATVYVSPTEEDSLVDPWVGTLAPGGERSGPDALSCESEYGTATHLTVKVREAGERDWLDEERVALDPGDCESGGGTVYDVTIGADGNATVAARG